MVIIARVRPLAEVEGWLNLQRLALPLVYLNQQGPVSVYDLHETPSQYLSPSIWHSGCVHHANGYIGPRLDRKLKPIIENTPNPITLILEKSSAPPEN